MNKQLELFLQELQATMHVMHVKLHHYHWKVSGSLFFTLHDKFEEYYTFAASMIDEVAERNMIAGGQPLFNFNQFIEKSYVLEEKDHNVSTNGMLKNLIEDFICISKHLQKGIELSQSLSDDVTCDMLIKQKEYVDKQTWMLRSTYNN